MAGAHGGGLGPAQMHLGDEAGGSAARELGGELGFLGAERRKGRVRGVGGTGLWCIARRG